MENFHPLLWMPSQAHVLTSMHKKLQIIFIGSTIKNIASTFFLNIKNLADCFWKLPIKIKPFLPTSLLLLSFLGPLAIFLTFLGYFHQSRVPKFPMSRNFLLHHAQKSQHSLTLEATPKFWCNLTVTLDMLMAIWIFFQSDLGLPLPPFPLFQKSLLTPWTESSESL